MRTFACRSTFLYGSMSYYIFLFAHTGLLHREGQIEKAGSDPRIRNKIVKASSQHWLSQILVLDTIPHFYV
jgi:hypothetical protein